jgi:transposase-like protein
MNLAIGIIFIIGIYAALFALNRIGQRTAASRPACAHCRKMYQDTPAARVMCQGCSNG